MTRALWGYRAWLAYATWSERLCVWVAPVALGCACAWVNTGLLNLASCLIAACECVLVLSLLWRARLGFDVPVGVAWTVSAWMRQTGRLAWSPLGAMLPGSLLAVALSSASESVSHERAFPYRTGLLFAAYLSLILSVFLGGVPVWCLLACLVVPLAVHLQKHTFSPEALTTFAPRLYILTLLFVWIGYLIQGLIR